jgi:hypothetical protein
MLGMKLGRDGELFVHWDHGEGGGIGSAHYCVVLEKLSCILCFARLAWVGNRLKTI